MGFDFIVIAPLLPSHCSFSFVFGCGVSFLVSSSVFLWGIFFGGFQCLPVDDCSSVSCDSSVLERDSSKMLSRSDEQTFFSYSQS